MLNQFISKAYILFPSRVKVLEYMIEALSTNTIPIVAHNTALKEIEIIGEFFNTDDEDEFLKK